MGGFGMGESGELHWFCFSYTGKDLDGGWQCSASTYSGFSDRRLTLLRIAEGKALAGVTDEAVLLSASYLGYMTKAEFLEGSEEGEGDGVRREN